MAIANYGSADRRPAPEQIAAAIERRERIEATRARAAVVVPTVTMLAHLTLASMGVFTVAVVAPEAAPLIGVEPTTIGLYVAAVYGFGALSGLMTGAFVTRFGPVRVCQFTMLLIAAGLLLLAIPSIPTAGLSAFLLGLAYGTLNPASAPVLSAVSSEKTRPLIFSIKQSGVPLGGVLAGSVVPGVAVACGWQVAALSVAMAAVVIAVMSQPLRKSFDNRCVQGASLGCARRARASLALVLKFPQLRALSLVSIAYAGCQICVGSFFVVYLTGAKGFSLVDAGIAFTALQAGGFIGRLLWGSIAGRMISPRVMLTVLGILMAVFLGVFSMASPAWSIVVYCAIGLGLGLSCYGWNGVFFSETAARSPEGKADAGTGAVQFVMFTGIVLFPPVFAGLVALFDGYAASFILLAIVVVLTAVFALFALAVSGAPEKTSDVDASEERKAA